jgi:uncharacterized protein (DUF488 family)
MIRPKIVTIGVYGTDEAGFFRALTEARVDLFCDLRLRRGMRGATYAFANSARLQQRLRALGIRYRHIKELAPSATTRQRQQAEDKHMGVAKRTRTELGPLFIADYTADCLTHFDAARFLHELGPETQVAALFCVEREPAACHRSLVARRLEQDLGISIEHLQP